MPTSLHIRPSTRLLTGVQRLEELQTCCVQLFEDRSPDAGLKVWHVLELVQAVP